MTENTEFNYQLPQETYERLAAFLGERYKDYQDPWGFDPKTFLKAVKILYPLYKGYFKVRVFGIEDLEMKPYIVVGNHSGQLPIDAMLISMAFILETKNPIVLRAMIERFMAQLPFIGKVSAELGSILGDRKNCQYLLEHGESILVFPEGVRGVSKNTKDYYKLQKFSTGFCRMAIKNKIEILPVAVVGAEEMYPFVYQAKKLAKFLKLPSFPITPLFPLAGPLGLVPLPSPIDIYIGKPYQLPTELSYDASENLIREHVYKIETKIKALLNQGLKNRRPFFDDIRKPVWDFFGKLNRK
ncbi:MAG: acyltransferase family protein [Bacteriovoracaceae bacterium]|nr:acyltransferase family protein [Bacteriovoracaceae bacterium]